MNKRFIIGIAATRDSGRYKIIRKLEGILRDNGFNRIKPSVFENNSLRIGTNTLGNHPYYMKRQIDYLIHHKCQIIVSSCLNYGYTHDVLHDTGYVFENRLWPIGIDAYSNSTDGLVQYYADEVYLIIKDKMESVLVQQS